MDTAQHNVTRADLVELTRERTGLCRKEARNVVETILQIVESRLRAGESVKISRFGTFTVKHEHSRRGRDSWKPTRRQQSCSRPLTVLSGI